MNKINVVHAFSGVDSQLMAEKRVWGDRVNLLATMEVDVDAIISCAAIHENEKFVKFLERDFTSEQYEQAKVYLKDRNIGFDFEKGKSKIDRMKKEKLRQLFIASKLTKNLGDISLANKVKMSEEVDIFTYSFPCTDISLSGRQDGLSKGSGTRSGLLWECEKFIDVNKPKVLLMENVKNLVQKKFINEFNEWCSVLEELGYKNYWKVLNAKNHGVPQNRERIFMVSIRKDVDCGYEFPEGFPLQTRLKDVLEKDVDPKYYLKDTAKFFIKNSFDMEAKGNGFRFSPHVADNANIGKCITTRAGSRMDDNFIIDVDSDLESFEFSTKNNELMQSPKLDCLGMLDIKGNECIRRVCNSDGLSPTLTTMAGGNRQPKILEEPTVCEQRSDEGLRFFKDNICGTLRTIDSCGDKRIIEPLLIKEATKKGYAEAYDGDSVNLEQPNSQTRMGRVGTQIANTLMTSCNQGVVTDYRIRKLTPKECWNLMDFDADAFDKVRPYLSDSALYKQAGNSIVVACMEHIFKNLDIDKIKGGSNER